MNVQEFRKSLKDCLDKAVRGESVRIERGGVVFFLVATSEAVAAHKSPAVAPFPLPKRAEDLVDVIVSSRDMGTISRPDLKFCKNGHPLAPGSTKCLQKGCK